MASVVSGEVDKTTSKKKRSFGYGPYEGGGFHGDHGYDSNFYSEPFTSHDNYYVPHDHHHHQQHTHSHTLVTKKYGIPVPQPYPVPYPVKVIFFLRKEYEEKSTKDIFRCPLSDLFPFRFQFIIIIRLGSHI